MTSEAERWAACYDALPLIVAVLRGADHIVEYANPACVAAFGSRSLVGMPARTALADLAGTGVLDLPGQVLARGETRFLRGVPIVQPDTAVPPRHDFGCAPLPSDATEARVLFFAAPAQGAGRAGAAAARDVAAGDVAAGDVAAHDVTDAAGTLKYEALLNAIPDGAFLKDSAGRFIAVNDAMARFAGLPRGAMLGRRDADLFPPDIADEFASQDARVMESDSMLRLERTIVDGDGQLRHTETLKVPFHDARGDVAGTAGIVRDITEHKRTAAALADSEARYRLMVEQSDEVFFYVHDAEGRFEYVSPSVEKVLGYRPGDLIGVSYRALAVEHPLNASADQLTQEAMQSGVPAPTYTAVSRHRDGSPVFLEIVERPIRRDGVMAGVHGFARDVTERTAAERQLAELNARLMDVVETSPLPIVVLGPDMIVQLWNGAAERLFGWTAGEVLGRPYPLRPADQAGPDPATMYRKAMAGEQVSGIELRRLAKDGRLLHLQFWDAPLRNANGEIVAAIGISADVSERIALEEQLRQAHKLEAIGRLAGGIAHDFNNVLTVIGGHAMLAAETVPDGTPLQDDLREISRAVERATELTRQLLAFSRRQVLQPTILDPGDVLMELRRMLQRLIGADIDLQTVVPDGLWQVRADRAQVEQVLLNLTVNSRDAMPDGGTLCIELANVVVAEDADSYPGAAAGEYVELIVRDSGCGIAEEHLPHIFEPFFTTKELGKGTGLGLATVHGVIAQSGGHLYVHSQLGAGTTFRIILPRTAGEADAVQSRESFRDIGSETILLVEDDPAVRAVARVILANAGYTVLEAESGAAALDLADRVGGDIDLLLTDVVMPFMNGQVLAERLLARRPLTRVLLMSGYNEPMVHDQTRPVRFPLLPKPFSPDDLRQGVRAALDGAATPVS
jgi:two-component system, cell cycle sensor histidine kinase and response regulator CckA